MPPVRMTREEYEKKYGVKPVINTGVELDTTPAPIRMTRAEYNAIYRPETPDPNLQQRLATVGEGATSRISDAIGGEGAMNDAGLLRRGTEATAAAFSVIPQGALAYAPKPVRGAIEAIGGVFERGFNAVTDKISDTSLFKGAAGQQVTQPDGSTRYVPNKIGVENALGVASNLGEISETIAGTQGTVAGINAVKPTVQLIRDSARARLVPTPDERVTSQANDILKVEEKYQGTRNVNARQGDAAEASRQRIAQSNVLEGAVDENGLIDTTEAIKVYRAQTIDGDEGKVRSLLEEEGKSVNLNEIRDALRVNVLDSGLEGGALSRAINGIEQQLKGLAIRADEFGNVPLAKLQDTKIAEYAGINFNTGPNTAKYKKTLARTYKEIIENKSDQNIKLVNEELSKFYSDIERLERLNGKRVEGGRLGKYGAQVVGSVAGAAGGSVGGGFGAMVGGVLGGELASKLKGMSMARTFNRGIDGKAPDNSVLKDAGVQVNLKAPDKKLGVPAGVKATPEMKKVEAQIARNVDLQKKAIKAGDFTLVAQLKEIYVVLVDKLKALIEDYRKNPPPMGLSIRRTVTPESVAKRADREDIRLLAQVIDNPSVAKIDPDIKRVLNDMGLGKATDEELVRFAKEVIDLSEGPDGFKVLGGDNLDPKNFKSAEELNPGEILKQNQGGDLEFVQVFQTHKGQMFGFKKANSSEDFLELFDKNSVDDLLKKQSEINQEFSVQAQKTTDDANLLKKQQEQKKERNILLATKEKTLREFTNELGSVEKLNTSKQLNKLIKVDGEVLKVYEHLERLIDDGFITVKELTETRGSKKGQKVKVLVSENGAIQELSNKGMEQYADYLIKTRTQLIDEWNKANGTTS